MHASRLPLLLSLGAVLVLWSPSRAQGLFAYEPFDYPLSGPIPVQGLEGGLAWAGPWIGADPLVKGMGSWWPLDADATDVGVQGSNGLVFGATFVADAPAALGWSPGSANFNGVGYIDLSAHIGKYQDLMRGTVAMWIKTPAGFGNGTDRALVHFGQANSPDFYCKMHLDDGRAAMDVKANIRTSGTQIRGNRKINDGNWHHVAFTSVGDGSVRIYVDGTPEVSGEEGFVGYVFDMDTMVLGRAVISGNITDGYVGQIDDLAIWGDALSASEILDLYNGTKAPIAVTGPRRPGGPMLAVDNLSPASNPQGAFTGTGFAAVGHRLADNTGQRGIRFMTTTLDFQVDANYYVSFLVRRNDNGKSPTACEVQFSEPTLHGLRIGWTSAGNWVVGLKNNAISSLVMQDQTTYFVVAKAAALGLLTNNDTAWLKVYGPGDTVHASESLISGIGTGVNQWAAQKIEQNVAKADTILLTQFPDASGNFNSTLEVDEIRIGPTWESVTGYGFGPNCLGLQIGRTNRPVLGSTDFAVDLSGASPNVPAYLFGGTSSLAWYSFALPLNLSSFGAPNCFLNVSADFFLPATTNSSGGASLVLPIPNIPLLSTFPLFLQWLAADAALTNPQLPAGFSDGMVLQVER